MSLFIDIHSHLDHPLMMADIVETIRRAKDAGVRHIVTNGIDPKTNRICLELSKKYDIVECVMGLYPKDALNREIVQEGKDGYLVNSVDELAQRMAYLAERPKLAEQMGRLGRKRVEKEFSWKHFLRRFGEACGKVAKEAK